MEKIAKYRTYIQQYLYPTIIIRSNLTIPDICKELGVSQRTLEYTFKDFYQMSPKNYLKKLRLNALYQSLHQNPQPTLICEIAEQLGFFHRGHLASDYQKLFGKLPSKLG